MPRQSSGSGSAPRPIVENQRLSRDARAWITRYAPELVSPSGHVCSFAVAVWTSARRRDPQIRGEALLEEVRRRRAAWLRRLGAEDLMNRQEVGEAHT